MKDEFELRGILASLLCWHRLTQAEAEDLLRFVAAQPVQPAQPAQEPVAEIVSDALGCLTTRWSDEWVPNEGDKLYTTPPAAQPAQEQNFCPRCGKRTADLTTIHTCTPPRENT